jgi:hypothetical protein
MTNEELGQHAYKAYNAVTGDDLSWDELEPQEREGWKAAALAIENREAIAKPPPVPGSREAKAAIIDETNAALKADAARGYKPAGDGT